MHSVLKYLTIMMRHPRLRRLRFIHIMEIPFTYKVIAHNQAGVRKCQQSIIELLNGRYGTPVPVLVSYYVVDSDGHDDWEHNDPPYNSTNRLREVLRIMRLEIVCW